jgi:hypothetical protein
MNTMKMITAMCAMGSTEPMGTFATPYKDDVADFIKDFFSGADEDVVVAGGEIKENTNYLYVYDERLGNNIADVFMQVYDNKYDVIAVIYLYEIED